MAGKKIVVAYSGGLDTSVMVKWLSLKYDAEIITVTGNLGHNAELNGLEEKARRTGASKSYILNLQQDFIQQYAWKALKAGAIYEGVYPLATAIGRPLIVKALVDIAEKEGADTIAHGCTGKGNDQVRFEVGIHSLAPHIKTIAPLRFWEFKSREEEIDYAIKHNIPVNITKKSPYSIDANLWGISTECGILEDPKEAPPADAYQITTNPLEAPDKPEHVAISFKEGVPVAIDGVSLSPVEIVDTLNILGARHGIGRLDVIENRVIGIKSREIYEAPAAVILHKAHYELEKMVLDRETFRYKQDVANKIANLIYDGLWFTPLFNALMSFVDSTQNHVEGTLTLQLYKGAMSIISRESVYSLYSETLATYTDADQFNHQASEGFIELYGLPYKTMKQLEKSMAVEV